MAAPRQDCAYESIEDVLPLARYIKLSLASPFFETREVGDDAGAATRRHLSSFSADVGDAAGTRFIPIEDIFYKADRRYLEWKSIHRLVKFETDAPRSLAAWIESLSEEEVALRLLTTIRKLPSSPGGLSEVPFRGFAFTPFQRLAMSFFVDMPFDTSVSCELAVPDLHRLALYGGREDRRRQVGMSCSYSMRCVGTSPRVSIVDLPTGCGKTAFTLAVAAMTVCVPSRFSALVEDAAPRRGEAFAGTLETRCARLILVPVAENVFEHFRSTALALIEECRLKWPDIKFQLWTKKEKRCSTFAALEADDRTVTFWIVLAADTNAILRAHPRVAVAVVIFDEFVKQSAPRDKIGTEKSPVLRTLVAQATPTSLVESTTGNASILKDYFGGELVPPDSVGVHVRRRSFKIAQEGLKHKCLLELLTPLTCFRPYLREDLRPLLPLGVNLVFVRCAYLSIASAISNSSVDIVPANLPNTILSHLSHLDLDEPSVRRVEGVFGSSYSLAEVPPILLGLSSKNPHTSVAADAAVRRLVERMNDFKNECPIFCSEREAGDMVMFGCCGYCVCVFCREEAFARDAGAAKTRCFYCRSVVTDSLPASSLPPASAARRDAARTDPLPSFPEPDEGGVGDGATFEADVARYTSRSSSQIDNLVAVLKCLARHDYTRAIVVVQDTRHAFYDDDERVDRDVCSLGSKTGFHFVCVDEVLRSGSASSARRFAEVKAMFDGDAVPKMAFFCQGLNTSFLLGSDLGKTQALVVVGNVNEALIDQTIGRVVRPFPSRDARRPIQLVKVFTGTGAAAASRRRPRD